MTSKKFTTETKNSITLEDFSIVRNLYMPIVGAETISLYELLVDYQTFNSLNRSFYDFADLQKTIGLTFDQLNQAKMKLEAVGLLRTFEKANNEVYVLVINKPLTAEQFRNNSLLYNQYVKIAGEEMFERVEFSNRQYINNKDDFQEVTMKFQDMFDINFDTKMNTIELDAPKALNKDEAIKGLTTMQFVKFLTNKKISPALMSIMQDLQKIGFSTRSINEIASYSYDVNGKIVARHVNAIATDLFNKKVTSADEIKVELSHALESRTAKVTPFIQEQSNSNTTETELEWDDIFNSLGDF